MREVINFNKNWLFHNGDINFSTPHHKGYAYISAKTQRAHIGPASPLYRAEVDDFNNDVLMNDDVWQNVSLPHDFVIGSEVKESNNNALGFFNYGKAWYVKRFILNNEDKNKRITLYFEGIATESVIYLNGCVLHRSFTGYTPFEVDITDFVKFDEENHLAVYVDSNVHEGWWYSGGGIYRNVKLIKTSLISVDLYGVYVKPIKLDNDTWKILTEVTVRNDTLEDMNVLATVNILDSNKNFVTKTEVSGIIMGKNKSVLKAETTLKNPKLWSPENPTLYYAKTALSVDIKVIDEYETHFGFRTFYADANKGFFINDKHYKIYGMCSHADSGLFGKAVPDNIHRYKVNLIKQMGANGYRASHYTQAEAVMDELDKLGFIVMNECRWFSSSTENLKELETLIKRDRNRPSVFFWSLGNEEYHHATDEGKRICKTMTALAKSLDDTRLIMTAVNLPDTATVYDYNDVLGINYCWNSYEKVRQKFPNKAVFASECCATGTTRGWYFEDSLKDGRVTAYDHDVSEGFKSREFNCKFIYSKNWLLGGYQWIAFEHRGEASWPRLCSVSGAIDLFLQKKDAFYQNKSYFTSAPMIHILPHWNFKGFEGKPIKVVAYTNLPYAELFVNGKSFGKQKLEKFDIGKWLVPYESGEIKVVGYNENGDIVCSDARKTSNKAYKLMLKQDTFDVTANGEDVAIFTCYAVDENGNEVYDADIEKVSFFTNGDCFVYSTGSDNTDHEVIFNTSRKMYQGKISVAVKLGTSADNLYLNAKSSGLISASIKIKVKN